MKIFKFFLVAILLMSIATSAYAAADTPLYQSHAVSHNDRNLLDAAVNGFKVQAEDYLINIWHGEITDLGDGKVELFGYTQCNRICDQVSVKLTLQQWTGSTWINLGSYTFYDYQTDYVEGVKTVSVEREKYYRVKSYHYAEDGLLIDETSATTEDIYVE